MKTLKHVSLLTDIIELISVPEKRTYYVRLDGVSSVMFDLLLGTVKDSVFGPVLYAIFVSPLFDNKTILSFADESFCH
jgi:hypothetical protein